MKKLFSLINSRRLVVAALWLLMSTTLMSAAVTLQDEELTYSIMYKWGLINKQAGTAVLTLRGDGDKYRAQLSAGTVPWADKLFVVRDTLQSVMTRQNYSPLKYVKIAHEGERYSYNLLNYSRQGNNVSATVKRVTRKDSEPAVRIDTVLHATEPGVDMLSVFYYIRSLDYSKMKSGDKIELNVFSGKRVELLTIRYGGTEKVKIDGKTYLTHAVTFTFTVKGKESDNPMYCWMSTDSQHIPLKMEGQLPFGKVQAFYQGVSTGKN